MRKLQLFGQAVLVALVIATTGFTSAEAQAQGAPARRPDRSFWDSVKRPPAWVPKNQPYGKVIRQEPPSRDTRVYSNRRKNQGYNQDSRVYSKERKDQGYKHARAGAYAQCRKSVEQRRKATNKTYTKHKAAERSQDQGLEQWYDKELREIAEAEQRCAELRSDPLTKEAHAPR